MRNHRLRLGNRVGNRLPNPGHRLPNRLPNTASSLGNLWGPCFHFIWKTQWFAPPWTRRRPPPACGYCPIDGFDWATHCLIDCAICPPHCPMDYPTRLGNGPSRMPKTLPYSLSNTCPIMPNRLPNALGNVAVPLRNCIAQSDCPINPTVAQS